MYSFILKCADEYISDRECKHWLIGKAICGMLKDGMGNIFHQNLMLYMRIVETENED